MAGLSSWVEGALIAWLKGAAMPAAPAALWVALWDGDPGDAAGTGQEVTATIRPAGRVAAALGAPSGGAVANGAAVDFGTAAGAASASHVALFDAATGGNLLASGPVQGGAQAIAAGVGVTLPAGALGIALT